MNNRARESTWVRVCCSADNGRCDEFVFPTDAIKASATGGAQEVRGFRSRLETARKTVKLSPDLRASFVKHFQPAVLNVACLFIAGKSFEALLKKLGDAGDLPAESMIDACNRYPYLRVLPESPDHFVIELVDEAISVQAMASELKEIIGHGLEQLCSTIEVADWATSHILAWTLEDLAHQEELQQELSKLSPAKADELLWNRAWRGEEFLGRFAHAVFCLASEIANFALDVIDLKNMSIREIETLVGLRTSRYYLSIASEADRGRNPILDWATTKYAGLQSSEALAVAETLSQGLWRKFSDERDLRRFIFTEAKRRSQEFDFIVLNSIGGLMPNYGVDNWSRCGLQALAAGQDSIMALADPDFSKMPSGTTDFSAVETLLSLKKAITVTDLSLDAQRVMYARIRDYTREDAHGPLQISKNRVSAGWRELHRKKKAFYRAFSR